MYGGAVSNKEYINFISMSKILRMSEFNKHLEEGIAHLKVFPSSKAQ